MLSPTSADEAPTNADEAPTSADEALSGVLAVAIAYCWY